ncbi:MAG TPA: hypothetical protein VGP93_19605, partial [Polyangiaceae bacterium]|nr:hypothetical protein [Polyangiaceae bacterium]
MHSWHASYDPKTLGHKHSVAPGFGHALFAPIAVSVFKILRISAAVWEHDQEWLPIHGEPQQLFEFEHGKEADRAIYNTGCLERARAEAQTVRGEFAGYSDFFVPISSHGNVVAVLVVGSFLREPLSSAGIQERWRALTGQKGHPSDPEFAAYLSHITSILVLADDKARALKRLLECLASLMAGEGPADELMNEIEVLRAELEKARFVERVWDVMRDVVDDLSKRHPQSGPRGELLRDFGLKKIADHVLVGLIVNR